MTAFIWAEIKGVTPPGPDPGLVVIAESLDRAKKLIRNRLNVRWDVGPPVCQSATAAAKERVFVYPQ